MSISSLHFYDRGESSPMNGFQIDNIVRFNEEYGMMRKKDLKPIEWKFGKVSNVSLDTLTVFDEKARSYTLRKADPVEITNEILEQCGFIKAKQYYYKPMNCMVSLYLVYALSKNPTMLCLGKGPADHLELTPLIHRLTALHQLMNIYFDHCKENLIWSVFPTPAAELAKLWGRKRTLDL